MDNGCRGNSPCSWQYSLRTGAPSSRELPYQPDTSFLWISPGYPCFLDGIDCWQRKLVFHCRPGHGSLGLGGRATHLLYGHADAANLVSS